VTTVTADKTNATILTPDMVEPGMHINGVGGDCPGKTELHADVLRGARVFVEYEPQTRIEGDLQQMPADFAVTELWQVLQAKRRAHGARTGHRVRLGRLCAGRLSRPCATCALPGRSCSARASHLALVPALADPKDLFSLIAPVSAAEVAAGMSATPGVARLTGRTPCEHAATRPDPAP
jgi:ornithine cyclodeaminase